MIKVPVIWARKVNPEVGFPEKLIDDISRHQEGVKCQIFYTMGVKAH